MRQAVVSAMALGAIGAVAAAAAALLGASGDPHTNTALDNTGPGDVVGATPGSHQSSGRDGLSVTVGTASGGSSSHASALGLPGTQPDSGANSPSGSASSTASAGGFYVSINQRDGDPDSVRILLRNAGTSALNWSAAPDVAWLRLSQTSGTLAPGQSLAVTATATSAAPADEWSAHIVFQPGAVVVTVHGGIPAGSTGSPGGSPTTSRSSSGAPSSGSPTTGTGSTPSSPPSSPSASSVAPSTSHSAPASSASTGGSVAPSGTSAAPASTSPTSPKPTRSATSGS